MRVHVHLHSATAHTLDGTRSAMQRRQAQSGMQQGWQCMLAGPPPPSAPLSTPHPPNGEPLPGLGARLHVRLAGAQQTD